MPHGVRSDAGAELGYVVCWSGGKDSMLALDRSVRAGRKIAGLVAFFDAASERIRFHGVPIAVMRAQAEALALPLMLHATTPSTFETTVVSAFHAVRTAGMAGVIFGDIHLADVRAWYEDRVRAAGLEHVEPLWGGDPGRLAREVVARGYTAILTCIEVAKADPSWLGRPLSEDLIAAFEQRGIDACGEHGEYHTLVTNGPLFHQPLAVRLGGVHVADEPNAAGRFHQLDVQLDVRLDEASSVMHA